MRLHCRHSALATAPRCTNQAFTINSGDLLRWSELWPRLARFFELDVAPLPLLLHVAMADTELLWQATVTKYDLAPHI